MRKRIAIAVIAFGIVGVLTGGAIAVASSDSEGGVGGPTADRAVTAALAATGGGTATAVERDGENGATWEVEVTQPDGSIVDVRLDENYAVIVVEGDSESPDTDDGSD